MARPDYEYLWRPNFEVWATIAWFSAATVSVIAAVVLGLGARITVTFAGIGMTMAALRASQTIGLWVRKTRLISWGIHRITLDDLERVVRAAMRPDGSGAIYLGAGFDITTRHTQQWYDLRKLDIPEITPPPWAMKAIARTLDIRLPDAQEREKARSAWIDAVEPQKKPILMPISSQAGHTFVVGTTGAGKTTLMLTVLMQRALQGAVVITIDPKGDNHMERMQRKAADRLGRPFVLIDPARPSMSARLNLIANFTRYTEVPSRIVATLADSDFKAFAWCFVSRFVAAMLMVGEKPDLSRIKRYILGGPSMAGELLERCISVWLREYGTSPEEILARPERGEREGGGRGHRSPSRADKLIAAYRQLSVRHGNHDVLDGMISTYEHDQDHYQRVTLNVVPVLEKMTAGDLVHLFSPNPDDLSDQRRIWDIDAIVRQRAIVYIRLDSLSDPEVGSIIGSMALASIVAVAGDRYNQGQFDVRVSVNVDELAEVVNIPFIQLLNKGRGALFDVTFFSQSVQDLSARLGSSALRDQVLENANNVIACRVSGEETLKFVLGRLGKTEIKTFSYNRGQSRRTEDGAHYGASVSESASDKEVDVFPRDLLPRLPDFSYVGYLAGGRAVKGTIPLLVS